MLLPESLSLPTDKSSSAKPMKAIKRLFATLLATLAVAGSAAAQESTFNPSNPPEPDKLYRVKVLANPADMANVSGTGYYASGQRIYVNSSSRDIDWELKAWTIDGDTVSTATSFYYTVTDKDVELVANFGLRDFNPPSPAEPDGVVPRVLTLKANPDEACSFNISSGNKYAPGSQIYVYCYINQSFVFEGWYAGEELLSTGRGYTYTMPDAAATLTARFSFNPDSPSEPDAVLIPGDVNVDYRVDSMDSMLCAKHITGASAYNNLFDVSSDGTVDSLDLSAIANIIITGE